MLTLLFLMLLVGLRILLALVGFVLFFGSAICVLVAVALAIMIGRGLMRLSRWWAAAAIIAASLGFLAMAAGAAL